MQGNLFCGCIDRPENKKCPLWLLLTDGASKVIMPRTCKATVALYFTHFHHAHTCIIPKAKHLTARRRIILPAGSKAPQCKIS
jgi:hypothetical protein